MKAFVAIILLVTAVSAEFPTYIKLCKRDSNLNDCIKENILSARSHLKDGIPSLFAIKHNPVVLSKDYEFQSGNLKMILYKDFLFFGLNDFDVGNVNFDLDKNLFELEWEYRKSHAYGKYRFEGDLLKYKVNSGGFCVVNTTHFGVSVKMQGVRQEKEGKTYINFNKIDSKFKPEKLQVYFNFEDLLPTAEETEAANKFLNENAGAATLQFKPVVDKLLIGLTAGSIQKLFNAHPIEELFPL